MTSVPVAEVGWRARRCLATARRYPCAGHVDHAAHRCAALQWLVSSNASSAGSKRQWQRQSRILHREMRLWLRDAKRHKSHRRRR